jgi:hypothetical protein
MVSETVWRKVLQIIFEKIIQTQDVRHDAFKVDRFCGNEMATNIGQGTMHWRQSLPR